MFFSIPTHTHKMNQYSIYLQAAGVPYGVRENKQNTNVYAHFCSETNG